MDLAQLESQALQLNEADRAVLVDHLQASLSSKHIEHLEEHITEAKDRLSAFRDGSCKSIDGLSFVKSLRSSISK